MPRAARAASDQEHHAPDVVGLAADGRGQPRRGPAPGGSAGPASGLAGGGAPCRRGFGASAFGWRLGAGLGRGLRIGPRRALWSAVRHSSH